MTQSSCKLERHPVAWASVKSFWINMDNFGNNCSNEAKQRYIRCVAEHNLSYHIKIVSVAYSALAKMSKIDEDDYSELIKLLRKIKLKKIITELYME